MEYKPLRFIGKQVEVQFDKQPTIEKKPGCPDRIVTKERTYNVTEILGEWQDYNRLGRMAHNMRPENAAVAKRRGSWGVGRFYFRIRTDSEHVFDIYYDRAPKNAADRRGAWFLYRELSEAKE
jgi:hypothetical protein